MARLNQRVWNNSSLTVKTKLLVYQACVLSTLLYSSEAWTTYAIHEKRLNSFHLKCLRRILHIKWQDKVPNVEVLERASIKSMFAILSERRLRWLGHVRRMESGRIPKDLLYGELAVGSRPAGRPRLRFRDVCSRDLKRCNISTSTWENRAENRAAWRLTVRQGTQRAEDERNAALALKRAKRKKPLQQPQQATTHKCRTCGRDCHSRVGLHSHTRKCR